MERNQKRGVNLNPLIIGVKYFRKNHTRKSRDRSLPTGAFNVTMWLKDEHLDVTRLKMLMFLICIMIVMEKVCTENYFWTWYNKT